MPYFLTLMKDTEFYDEFPDDKYDGRIDHGVQSELVGFKVFDKAC